MFDPKLNFMYQKLTFAPVWDNLQILALKIKNDVDEDSKVITDVSTWLIDLLSLRIIFTMYPTIENPRWLQRLRGAQLDRRC